MKARILLICAVALFLIALFAEPAQAFFEAKFEPPDGQVLHGAGQSPDAFMKYWDALPETRPAIFMVYFNVHNSQAVQKSFDRYFGRYPKAIPQVGLTFAGKPPERKTQRLVAEGELDRHIRHFAQVLRDANRPVFIRPGYEFNGPWNDYDPDLFIKSFKRIVNIFREEKADNVAFIWCYALGANPYFMRWYPGDEYVDWWGIDIFVPKHINSKQTFRFLDAAIEHKKPVMICESTPKFVGVLEGEKSWKSWFEAYFDLIRTRGEIKGFCYINWDWARYKQWSNWGDARLEENEEVLRRYREEMKNPIYIHYSDEVHGTLGYEGKPRKGEAK